MLFDIVEALRSQPVMWFDLQEFVDEVLDLRRGGCLRPGSVDFSLSGYLFEAVRNDHSDGERWLAEHQLVNEYSEGP